MTTQTPTLEERKQAYEEKRQARLERLRAYAAKVQAEATSLHEQAHSLASVIPLGQPILVGHHSERRDRNYRERIHNKYRRGFELSEKARQIESRIESAENNDAIYSDDPTAIEQLKAKLAGLIEFQEKAKAINKLIKKNDRAGLADLGLSEEVIEKLLAPDFANRIGIPSYRLTNNNANIRRIKQRIEYLERHAADVTTTYTIAGIKVTDNVEDNRLQIHFPGKPSEEVRKALKSSGFRWTPSLGVWQAYRGNHAKYQAENILRKYYEGGDTVQS